MSADFDFGKLSRRCHATDRELAPGETVYSVVVAEGAEIVRQDFCEEAWEAPPEEAIGWWKSTVPDLKTNKTQWAPNEILLRYFESLADEPDKADVRYVTALLLVRRRILQEDNDWEPEADETTTDESSETEEAQANAEHEAAEILRLIDPQTETQHAVAKVEPTAERIAEISEELKQLLTSDT